MKETMLKLINAKYSLPTWLWVIASTLFAAIVLMYTAAADPIITEFTDSLPLGGWLWSILLLVAGISSMIGMATGRIKLHRYAAMTGFVMWLFGTLSWIIDGYWENALIFGLTMMVFWGYKYLASYVREFPRL